MSQSVSQRLLSLKIIFGSLALALAVYCVVGFVIVSGAQTEPLEEVIVKYVLYIAALVDAGAGLFGYNLLKNPKRLLAANPSAPAGRPVANDQYGKPVEISAELIPLFSTASIVGGALSESVAIFGLVIAILFHDLISLFVMSGVSLVLLAFYFPREARLLVLQREYNELRRGVHSGG